MNISEKKTTNSLFPSLTITLKSLDAKIPHIQLKNVIESKNIEIIGTEHF